MINKQNEFKYIANHVFSVAITDTDFIKTDDVSNDYENKR